MVEVYIQVRAQQWLDVNEAESIQVRRQVRLQTERLVWKRSRLGGTSSVRNHLRLQMLMGVRWGKLG